MKTCPACGTTYDARVDFCFRDGEVLTKAPAKASPGNAKAYAPAEDEFDRPLPDTAPPAAAPAPRPQPSATDLPQPRFVSSATDLPEPAFLQRETIAETAPFPTTPSPEPRTPIPDDETLPMPLGGAVIAPPVAAEPVPVPLPPPAPAAPEEALQPLSDPAPFVPPAEPAFAPEPAPLPPVQPTPGPELEAWATPEPPPRMDEDEGRGGPPWAIIAVLALLLLGVGGFFAWRSSQDPGGTAIADADPALSDPGQDGLAGNPATEPASKGGPPTDARPVADPEPAVADLEPDPILPAAEPEGAPADAPTQGEPAEPRASDPGASADPVREPAVQEPAVREPTVADVEPAAQPWDAPEPSDLPQIGTIKINSVPAGATLFLDGQRVGTAPYSAETTQGRHKVRAEAEGYKPVEIMVSLNGEIANANLTLQRDVKTQQVMLYGPAGAKSVSVAGQSINALPATISLPVGRHVFTVTQADGSSFQVSQTIAEGGQANVMLLPPE